MNTEGRERYNTKQRRRACTQQSKKAAAMSTWEKGPEGERLEMLRTGIEMGEQVCRENRKTKRARAAVVIARSAGNRW